MCLKNRESSPYVNWFDRIAFDGNSNYNDGLWYEGCDQCRGAAHTAHFDAGCGRAVDLITGQEHDFGGGSELPDIVRTSGNVRDNNEKDVPETNLFGNVFIQSVIGIALCRMSGISLHSSSHSCAFTLLHLPRGRASCAQLRQPPDQSARSHIRSYREFP